MKLSKKAKLISSAITVFVFLLVVVAIIGIGRSKPENLLKVLPEQVDLEIDGFVYTEVGEGEGDSSWEVKADKATYQRQEGLAVFNNVKITLNTADGKVYLMTADEGQMFTEKKDIEIQGNVVITSNEGDKFTTDYLNYSDAEKKFYTDAPVTMENNRIKISGTGLTLYVRSGELNLASAVKAKIK